MRAYLAFFALTMLAWFAPDQAPALQKPDANGFIELCNGKDITGWEGLEGYWSVKDGALTGTETKANSKQTFLVLSASKADPAKFANFELHTKYRFVGPDGNSGIQFRSKIIDAKTYRAGGYQADLDAKRQYDGGMYDEAGVAGNRAIMANRGFKTTWDKDNKRKNEPLAQSGDELKKLIKPPDEWNDMILVVDGNHFTIKINGNLTADVIDNSPKMVKDGVIALQLHQGYTMTVQFKDMKIKLLNQKAKQPAGGSGKATPVQRIKMAKDFKVELLYSVPRAKEGSWVRMCVDPEGRLIVSDQGGAGLFRVTPPALDGKPEDTKVEKIPAQISGAQGLLWAFDSLYVTVNGGGKGGTSRPNGLYRVRASKPGGELDKVEQLRTINGGGEHGPHAVKLSPDGKSLFLVSGNDTKLTTLSGSYLPKLWGEDRLFPLVATFGGVTAPAGHIDKLDPDGKNWELWCAGFRNAYDIAFNRHGDLFTFDSDMEYDMNQPWYRPTRVCLAVSGGDFGFRNGSSNSPPRYPDTVPALYNIGPGSPTGVVFGYGSKFPAKYQEALFIEDWSYGRMFAVHLAPEGSAYKAQVEEFLTGTPLAMTDLVVNPKDGALYFMIGGRNAQSGLYRVTYTGKESTAPSSGDDNGADLRALRHKLESFHGHSDPNAVEIAWPFLSHEDRYIRYAARVAIEHNDPKEWQERALTETRPTAAINALLALVRAIGKDPLTVQNKGMFAKGAKGFGGGGKGGGGGPMPGWKATDKIPGVEMKAPILEALNKIDWNQLSNERRSDLLRAYVVLFSRLGGPDRAERNTLIRRLDPEYPAKTYEVNADLCQLLVYLEAPGVAGKTLKLMAAAPSQEEQMDYAKSLRMLETGWTSQERQAYFAWFLKAAKFRGGQTLNQALGNIKQQAVALLSAKEKAELKPWLDAKPAAAAVIAKPRPLVKQWTVADLTPIVEKGLAKRDFDHGRQLFGEAKCFVCHRFDNEGGTWAAPDLTLLSGRYSVSDILESIIEPSKVISDQFAATVFTMKDGRVIVGRMVNLQGDSMSVVTDMLSPSALKKANISDVESMELSKVSPMPTGLLDGFHEDEILDLMAYLLSRGDRNHEMFKTRGSGLAP